MLFDKIVRTMFAVAGIATVGTTTQGNTQESQTAARSGVIEEITVTARRREESLQEVPIAISAFGGEELESRGIEAIRDLNATAPNVSVMGGATTAESQGSFVVRGIPGVSTYVDGIWQSTTDGLFTLGVIEVERIEVLRGPQGTLFGKNAIGGAIQYVTRRPGDTFGARISATGGSFDRRDVQASIDLPITDRIKTKITGASLQRDGYIRSLQLNRDYGDVDDELIRGDLLWSPTDKFELRLTAEESNVERDGPARVLFRMTDASYDPVTGRNTNPRVQGYINAGIPLSNVTQASGWPGGEVGRYETNLNWENPGLITEVQRYTADMTYEINPTLRVRSLTGYREYYRTVQTDFDAFPVTLLEREFKGKGRQVTQELQVLGETDRFDWVLGGYYWREPNQTRLWTWIMTSMRNPNMRAAALAGGQGVAPGHVTPVAQDALTAAITDGLAFFGDVTWRVTDKLSIAAGIRQNDEDFVSYTQRPVHPVPLDPDSSVPGSEFAYVRDQNGPRREISFSSTTPRLSLQYQWTPSLMTYVAYAEGFGAGGINVPNLPQFPDIPEQIPFFPEELQNYEIGMRADWLDGRLRTNLTGFYGEYDGIQVDAYLFSSFIPGSVGTRTRLPNLYRTNAGAAEVKGVELESTLQLFDRLRLGLNGGWLDAAYTEVGAAQTAIREGSRFQQAPEYTLNFNASYSFPLRNGVLTPRVDYTYTDEYRLAVEDDRQVNQEAFGILNARLTYAANDNWSISAFGSNLTNEYYRTSGFWSESFQIEFGTIGQPREYGLTLSFTFQ